MTNKILWKTIRDRPSAWSHIKTVIKGRKDLCMCRVCGLKVKLEVPGRERSIVLRETARKHYYKHKLWDGMTAPDTSEPIERYEILDAIRAAEAAV